MTVSKVFSGKAWKFGDHIDTDVIIPARYLVSSDEKALGAHCMVDIDKDFVNKISPGDMIVAGENFGCGSSREHAPLAIKGAPCSCVIAASFARIFYRNAINVGLPIFECPEVPCDRGRGIRGSVCRDNRKQNEGHGLPSGSVRPVPAGPHRRRRTGTYVGTCRSG